MAPPPSRYRSYNLPSASRLPEILPSTGSWRTAGGLSHFFLLQCPQSLCLTNFSWLSTCLYILTPFLLFFGAHERRTKIPRHKWRLQAYAFTTYIFVHTQIMWNQTGQELFFSWSTLIFNTISSTWHLALACWFVRLEHSDMAGRRSQSWPRRDGLSLSVALGMAMRLISQEFGVFFMSIYQVSCGSRVRTAPQELGKVFNRSVGRSVGRLVGRWMVGWLAGGGGGDGSSIISRPNLVAVNDDKSNMCYSFTLSFDDPFLVFPWFLWNSYVLWFKLLSSLAPPRTLLISHESRYLPHPSTIRGDPRGAAHLGFLVSG